MKRRLRVFSLVVAVLLLIGTQAAEAVYANPWAFSAQINAPSGVVPPVISVSSPQNNALYSEEYTISVSVEKAQYGDYFSDIYEVTYTIDNKSVTAYDTAVLGLSSYNTSFAGPNLTTGNHTLTVKATGILYKPMRDYFLVDKTVTLYFFTHRAPSIKLLTNQSANNPVSSFSLNFTVDEPTSWLGYSLDNSRNVTIGANTTLTGLSVGNHSLVIFGNSTFGDMARSETTNFTAKDPEATLPLVVIAPVAFAIIFVLGLGLYFKRRRGKQ
jgi:hypothetical protein